MIGSTAGRESSCDCFDFLFLSAVLDLVWAELAPADFVLGFVLGCEEDASVSVSERINFDVSFKL